MTEEDTNYALSRRQEVSIPLLVTAPTIEEGCRSAGISRSQYYKWINNSPAFVEELERRRMEIFNNALNDLKNRVGQAVETLFDLLDSDNDAIRRQAANDIINTALRLKDQEIEDRLVAVESLLIERKIYSQR